MTWISSPARAAIAGAVTSAPLGVLAHRYRWAPFKYDNDAEAAVFAASIGALSAVAWYWGIERYLRENLPTPAAEPEPPPGGVEI